MKKNSSVGFNSLAWVKHEIDHSLDLARTEISSFAEAPENTHHLDRAVSLLRDVQGTLDVAELEGAAMLAEETLAVVKALADKTVTNTEDACKHLIRALIQLPDYLDFVQTGQEDTPLVLVSVLNDLRAVRKVDYISDKLSGIQGLDEDGAVLDGQVHSGEDLQSIAELTRLVFELGLLGWYRNSNVEESMGKMALVCRRLRVASKHRASRRLWWSAEALTQALLSNSLESSDSIKTLLGRVDREIKRLFNVGEDTFSATISLDLVKRLLYYIAISKPGNEIVDEVRSAYFLDEDIPSAESLEGFQTSLSGHNKALSRSVAMSLSEDLEEIKELLDQYHRSETQSADDLQVLIPLLSRLGETFTALNLAEQTEEVSRIQAIFQSTLDEQRTLKSGELEVVAQSLIEFEQSILGFGIAAAPRDGAGKGQALQPSDEQFDEVRSVVIKQVLSDIDQCKVQIQRYASGLCSISDLSEVLQQFSRVSGAMHLLNLDSASVLVTDIQDYLATKIEEKSNLDDSQLDYLAESIAAVEVYLEVLEASKIEQDSFIETGRSSLNVLRAIQAEPAETGEHTEFISMSPSDVEKLSAEDEEAVASVKSELQSFSAETERDTDVPELPDDLAIPPSSPDVEDEARLEPIEMTTEIPDVGELPDFEKPAELDVSEEAVIEQKDASLAQTEADPSSESLVEMEALNLDDIGTLNIDFGAIDELSEDDTDSDLHELAATLHGNDGMDTDFLFDESLIDSLQDQSQSEIHSLTQAAVGSGTAKISDETSTQAGLPEVFKGLTILANDTEDDIYEIFLEEFTEESDRLKQQFPKWKKDSTAESPLIQSRRSFHTIKGSGRLIGAQIIGEFAWIHEQIFNQVIDGTLKHETAIIECLEQGIALLPRLKKQLEERKFPDQPVNQHILWAEQIVAGEIGAKTGVVTATETSAVEEKAIKEFDVGEMENVDPLPTLSAISADHIDLESSSLASPENEVDLELIEVFLTDARRNLKTLRESAAAAQNAESWKPGEAVTISVHTLNGSARTASVEEIYLPFSACEKYLRAKINASLDFDRDDADALLQLAEHAKIVLDQLEAGTALSSSEEFTSRFTELSAALEENQASTETSGEAQIGHVEDAVETSSVEFTPADALEAPSANDRALDEVADEEEVISEPTETSHIVLDSIDLPDSPPGPETLGATMVSELVYVFLDECQELLGNCDAAMVRWQKDAANLAPVGEIKRELHTLKGSARMAEIEEIGNLSHALETLLSDITEGRIDKENLASNGDVFAISHAVFDKINTLASQVKEDEALDSIQIELDLLEKVRAGESLTESDFLSISDVAENLPESSEDVAESEQVSVEEEIESPVLEELQGDLDLPVALRESKDAEVEGRFQEAIRIRAELLDRLVDNIGEVNVFHSRVEQQIGSFDFNLKELNQTVRRVTEQLRSLELEAEAQILHRHKDLPSDPDKTGANEDFDPLELDRYSKLQQLSRSLAESTGDLKNIHQLLVDEVSSVEKILQQQSKVSNELQEGLMQTRMSKFEVMAPRLRRVVRRTALDLGKEVEFNISGDSNEMDRKMLESIIVPLEHLLRNAVAHGIESSQERKQAGKEDNGKIEVSISREGAQIVISVADDGAGINTEKVLTHAVKTGLVSESEKLSTDEINSLILKPGFTTAEELNQVAGRGVGMDVVAAQLKQLNGVMEIHSEEGKGAEFRLSIPFTLAINQSLLVLANHSQYAVPMGSIEGVLQIPGRSLEEKISSESGTLTNANEVYKIFQMSSVLEKVTPHPLEENHVYPLLLARLGEERVAFIADEILGNREIVVKPAGSLLGSLEGLSGASILGDGEIILIADIAGMIRQTQQEQTFEEVLEEEDEAPQKLVMVVDDSITIRKVTSRMLERHNFSVVTAKDGLDAVAQLQEVVPDMMLLDIEMPRMDGFELAEHVRKSEQSADLPIIMISSRTGKKHRERAQLLGVNQFLGKPYQDQELLENINFLLDGEKNEQNRIVH